MARKIILFFMFFLILNTSVSFCADNYPTITLEQSEAIFDFILNTSKRTGGTLRNQVSSSSALSFMNYFNKFVAPKFYEISNGECNSSEHFIVIGSDTTIMFVVTNATLSNELNFVNISYDSSSQYNVSSQYLLYFYFSGNDSYNSSVVYKNGSYSLPLFYNDNGSISYLPKYDDNFTTLLTPNLFYLGPKSHSDVNFKPYDGDSFSWYFLEHCFGPVDSPSGDIPSGDTPSGDIPSGDTPNYNDKLDNISSLIGDTNTKLDGISGEIAQTNNKLDGISGEIGEINDNLTTVPDLSGTTINSGDIESALNFDFAENPYSNFWLELNTGLSSALTSSNRSININFRNKLYTISLDNFALQVPEFLKSFLAIISTVLVVWQIVRYIKVIVDKISSGDMDTVLAINEEERNS